MFIVKDNKQALEDIKLTLCNSKAALYMKKDTL